MEMVFNLYISWIDEYRLCTIRKDLSLEGSIEGLFDAWNDGGDHYLAWQENNEWYATEDEGGNNDKICI